MAERGGWDWLKRKMNLYYFVRSQWYESFVHTSPFHLHHQSGGVYSAEDADSVPANGGPEKREGAFCVWTASEIRELFPNVVEGATGAATQADIFMHHYGVKEQGNVAPEQVLKMSLCVMSHNYFTLNLKNYKQMNWKNNTQSN